MKKTTVKFYNRYDETITFVQNEQEIWMSGGRYCRYGTMNNYDSAYSTYKQIVESSSGVPMTESDFKSKVHTDENFIAAFMPLVNASGKIVYVDPSGGPFIAVGGDMSLISPKLRGTVSAITNSRIDDQILNCILIVKL